MSLRRIVCALLACGPGAVWLHAQGQVQPLPPRFATELELVTVDVSVVDSRGQPVTGLRQDDFLVLENGTPREVVAFQAVVVPEHGHMPVATRPAAVSTNGTPPPAGRTFVVLFDDLHLTHTQAQRGRAAVALFLRTGVAAGDRVTLISTGTDIWWHARLPQGRDELLEILETLGGRYPIDSSAERISEWEAYRIEVHQDMDVALQIKRRFDSYGAAGQARLSGPIPREDIAKSSLEGIIDPVVRGRASAVYNAARSRNRATLGLLARALRALSDVPGRKAIVLVSQGFVHEPELREMREAVHASVRANAPVYFINTRGLAALPEAMSAAQAGPLDAQDTLLALTDAQREAAGAASVALDTGGFVVDQTNDLARGLLQVSRESRSYYLLAYRPVNLKPDGRLRRIDVRLRPGRDGLTVKARRGYYARADAPPQSKAGEDPAIVSALDAPFDLPDLPLRTTDYAFEAVSASAVKVLVTTDVDVRPFTFSERDGRFEGSLAYVIDVRERQTGQRYRYDEKVEMSLQPATRERLWRTWYSLSREFTLPAGAYRARVAVRDLAGGRLGSVTHDLEVPETSGFRISTPILSDIAESDGTVASLRPVLIARRTFQTDTTLYVQYLVYGAAQDPATKRPRVTGGYELRHATGAVFKRAAPTPIAPASSGTLRRLHGISLAGAGPGEYELVLTVTDETTARALTIREPLTIAGDM